MYILLSLLLMLISGCEPGPVPDATIPADYVESAEYFDEDRFMDWVDYCRYTYPPDSRELFAQNVDYSPVCDDDLPTLRDITSNFAQWAEDDEHLREVYDFDPACMDEEDFYSLAYRLPECESYTLCYFDAQSDTLYYMDAKW